MHGGHAIFILSISKFMWNMYINFVYNFSIKKQ